MHKTRLIVPQACITHELYVFYCKRNLVLVQMIKKSFFFAFALMRGMKLACFPNNSI